MEILVTSIIVTFIFCLTIWFLWNKYLDYDCEEKLYTDSQPKVIYCEDCKKAVNPEYAQRLEFIFPPVGFDIESKYYYYCPEHRKPYDIHKMTNFSNRYYKKKVEVNEKGKIITRRNRKTNPHQLTD